MECVWKRVFVVDFVAQNGGVETGNDRLFPCRRVDPKTKNDGRHERTNARASFAHDGDKHLDEHKHRTRVLHSPESQLCQALRGNNGMTAGRELLESEQMDCKGAGVVQTTSWAVMAVVVSMASMAPMAPMASMVASMAPMASMVVASMASMAWMDLMAPELKSERESAVGWRAFVASHSSYQALCFAFVQMSSWYTADEFAFSCHTEGE